MKTLVSLVVPLYNSKLFFQELLDSFENLSLDTIDLDIVLIDSGSSDGSIEAIKEHTSKSILDYHLIDIPKGTFNHGGTRNHAIAQSKGDYIVLLTQDATPYEPSFLVNMVQPMLDHEDVVLVTGRQIPREDHSPLVKRDMNQHFDSYGISDGYVKMSAEGPKKLSLDQRRFHSNVNAAIRRSFWKDNPFRTVDYCEDQLMGRDVITKKYAKAYSYNGAVYHSHNYPPVTFFKRMFDEYRGLKITLDYVDGINRKTFFRYVANQFRRDIKYIKQSDISVLSKLKYYFLALPFILLRRLGAYLGGRHEKVPGFIYSALSLEKKKKDKQVNNLPTKRRSKVGYLMSQSNQVIKEKGFGFFFKEAYRYVTKGPIPKPVASVTTAIAPQSFHPVKNSYHYDFIFDYDGKSEFKPQELDRSKKLTINWFIPEVGKGSGGHLNILRVVKGLEEMGHNCHIYVMPFLTALNSEEQHKIILDHFLKVDAKVQVLTDVNIVRSSDVTFATSWMTAYPLYKFNNTRKKLYFIQDYECMFYPQSSEFIFAENTYMMNYKGITAGKWLTKTISAKYNMPCNYFELSYPAEIYFPNPIFRRQKKKILFYARHVTPRRGFELGILALKKVKATIKDAHIVFIGWDSSGVHVPFQYENRGRLNFEDLAALYNEATVGVVLSLTNYSLLPQEMMACGLPVIDINRDNTTLSYDQGQVVLAEPDPNDLADKIIHLIQNPDAAEAQRRKALDIIRNRTISNQNEKIEQMIYDI